MRFIRLFLLTAAAVIAFSFLAPHGVNADDVITLVGGRKITGTIIEETKEYLKIRQTGSGVVSTFKQDEVDDIKRGPDVRKEFASRFDSAKKNKSADELYELGAWISKRIPELADKCFKAALEINPEHAPTHAFIGEELVDGKWVKKEAEKPKHVLKPEPKTEPAPQNPSVPEAKPEPGKDAAVPKDNAGEVAPQMAVKPFKDDKEKNEWIDKIKKDAGFSACVETKNYFIFTVGDTTEATNLGKLMDKMFGQWKTIFNFEGTPPRKLPIWLYGDQQTFMRAQNEPPDSGGFFDGEKINTYKRRGGGGASLQEVLFHEGTHQFECLMIPNMLKEPDRVGAWLIEGLAVYFEPSVVAGGDVTTNTIPQERCGRLKMMIMQNRGMSLKDLITTPLERFVAPHYEYGWGLVYFMVNYSNGKYRKKFVQYWKFIMGGGANTVENFEKTVGTTLDKMEDEFKAYYRAGVK